MKDAWTISYTSLTFLKKEVESWCDCTGRL